jgi:hypothetical protein
MMKSMQTFRNMFCMQKENLKNQRPLMKLGIIQTQQKERAGDHQTTIGWPQLLLGRWSQQWSRSQSAYISGSTTPPTFSNHGPMWASILIRVIWKHCYQEWLTRNEARHGKDQAAQTPIRIRNAKRQIRALYMLRNKCLADGQRKFFYQDIDTHFTREPHIHSLETWIITFEPMIRSQVKLRQELHRLRIQPIDDLLTAPS